MTSVRDLGILTGGQLGRMMLPTCMRFGLNVHIMDGDASAPAGAFCRHFVQGDPLSARIFSMIVAKMMDVLRRSWSDKGYGIMMLIEILTGSLIGGMLSTEQRAASVPWRPDF